MYQQTNSAVIISFFLIVCSILSLTYGGTMRPSGFLTSLSGGRRPSNSSTTTGISELFTNQQSNTGQTLSFQASGPGMVIGLNSNVGSEGYTTLAQSGGISEPSSVGANPSFAESGIIPESAIQLDVEGINSMNLELDSHALGWEHVDAIIEQQAQLSTHKYNGATTKDKGWLEAVQNIER